MGDFLVVGVHSDGKCYTVLPTYDIVEYVYILRLCGMIDYW